MPLNEKASAMINRLLSLLLIGGFGCILSAETVVGEDRVPALDSLTKLIDGEPFEGSDPKVFPEPHKVKTYRVKPDGSSDEVVASATASLFAVDRVFQDGSFLHVMFRVSNGAANDVARLHVACDVFDHDGTALGKAAEIVDDVPAGSTTVGEALAIAPPGKSDPATAKCRITH